MNPGGFGGRKVGIRCSGVRRALEQMGMSEGSRDWTKFQEKAGRYLEARNINELVIVFEMLIGPSFPLEQGWPTFQTSWATSWQPLH